MIGPGHEPSSVQVVTEVLQEVDKGQHLFLSCAVPPFRLGHCSASISDDTLLSTLNPGQYCSDAKVADIRVQDEFLAIGEEG